MRRLSQLALIVALVPLFAACSSYYMVRDPANGNTYYTQEVNDAGKAGSVRFTDEKSGSTVTLPQSEVTEISGGEYKAGVREKR
jgi:hypothetical protein